MVATLTDLSGRSMTRAIQDNLFEFWGSLRKSPHMKVDHTPEMIRYITGVPFPLMNGVLRARFRGGAADKKIDEALAPFRGRKLPMMWWTAPSDTPRDLPQRLVAAGLAEAAQTTGMAIDLQKLNENVDPPRGLDVQRLGSQDDLAGCNDVLSAAFGMPGFVAKELAKHLRAIGSWPEGPWLGYLGRLEGRPVATSLAAFAAGVAGIYNVATLEDARGRGIGAAITLAPLRDARRMGYRIAILHASAMGFPVYRRLGFREYCKIGQYVWTPAGDEGPRDSSSSSAASGTEETCE
jgi:GNAT superfamily N-acetyltransferase